MKMIKCPENHFYDSDKYDSCPLCAKNKRNSAVNDDESGSKTRIVKISSRAVKIKKQPEVKKPEVKSEPKQSETKKPEVKSEPKQSETKKPEVMPELKKPEIDAAASINTKSSEEIAEIIRESISAPSHKSKNKHDKFEIPEKIEKKTEPKEVKFPDKKTYNKPPVQKTQEKRRNMIEDAIIPPSESHKPVNAKSEKLPAEITLEDTKTKTEPMHPEVAPKSVNPAAEKLAQIKKEEQAAEKQPEFKRPKVNISKLAEEAAEAKTISPVKPIQKTKESDAKIISDIQEEIGEIEDVESIVIDDTNNMAINTKTGTLVKYIGTTEAIKIPDTITTIGKYAFRGNETLKKIVMSDSVRVVDKFAFCHCFALEEIVLSENLESIGENAFLKCLHLKTINFPESLKRIGKGAFGRCNSLENIVLPAYLQRINDLTFFSCKRLRRIVISGSVESIGSSAFSECYNLRKVVISDSVTSIGESAFAWCKALEVINIPANVKTIGNWAFYGCQELHTLRISWMTKDVKENAFTGCDSLFTINIAEFDNPDIKIDEVKKGHKQTVRILRQINRKKAERYAHEHGVSMLFM